MSVGFPTADDGELVILRKRFWELVIQRQELARMQVFEKELQGKQARIFWALLCSFLMPRGVSRREGADMSQVRLG